MKTVLITGVSGFIGKSLAIKLQNEFNINVLVRKKCGDKWNKEILCDLAKDEIPANIFDGVNIVFHLAGMAHDTNKATNIEHEYRKINTEATVKLAELAAKNGVEKFIFISSIKAGGTPKKGVCANELDQGFPVDLYGETKRRAEIQLLELGKSTGMHVSIIRPALVYGAGVKGNLKLMLNGISKGWFPPLPDTANIRTMVHIDDLVKAIILVSKEKQANGEIFIVTDEKKYSSREIYNEICIALGKKVANWSVPKLFFIIAAKLGDVLGNFTNSPFDSNRYQKLLADDCYNSDKIRLKLGFKPSMTFKDALATMIEKKIN